MPSKRRQFNVRPDDETWEMIDRLTPAIHKAIGLPVSQSDLLRLGVLELWRKHFPGEEPPAVRAAEPKPAAKPKQRARAAGK